MNTWTPSKIKALRHDAKLTQRQLAAWCGVVTMNISHLEQAVKPPGKQTTRLLDLLFEKVERGETIVVSVVTPKATREMRRRPR